jgi:hypothetical protein
VAEQPLLVAPEVTAAKIAAHLEDWRRNGTLYRSRGWFLTRAEGTDIEIAFVAPNLAPGFRVIPVSIRLDYANYDVWAPSLTFIDPLTGDPAPVPIQAHKREGPVLRDLIPANHPQTGRPYLCLPGIREYHSHPQHSGDDWLRYRLQRLGSPAVIAQWIWEYMTGTVLGLGVNLGISLQQQAAELSELGPAGNVPNGTAGESPTE